MNRKYVFILAGLFISSNALFISCKKIPTLSYDSPLDPHSESFRPTKPQNLRVETIYGPNELTVIWEIPRPERFISIFKVYKSNLDTTQFEEVATLDFYGTRQEFDDMTRYRFTDPELFDSTKVWYKVESHYFRANYVRISQSVTVSYSNNSFNIQNNISPFSHEPFYSLIGNKIF